MTKFQASNAIVDELDRQGSSAKEKLLSEGWHEHRMWTETSLNGQKSLEEARVLCRDLSLIEKCREYIARKTLDSNIKVSNVSVGNISVNRPHKTMDIHSLQDLTSIQNMRSNKESLTLALDTEFVTLEKERRILSYQFAFYDQNDLEMIHEVIFLPVTERRLSFWRMMSWILTEFNLGKSHELHSAMRWLATVKSGEKTLRKHFMSPEEAYEATVLEKERDLFQEQFGEYGEPFRSKNNGIDGGYIFDFSDFVKNNITLVCHWGQADLSTFEITNSETDELEIIANCTKIQGGLVTLKPTHKLLKDVQNQGRFYYISLNIRDTMCFAPAGQKSLKNLGDSIYVKKLELPYNAIEHMDRYFHDNPVHYMDYAANDSLIGLIYSSELWGINKAMPVTTTSGAVKAAKTILKKHFEASNDNEFNLRYRGILLKSIGKEKNSSHNGRRFKNKKCLEPISDDAFILMNMAANAYNGGFNGCLGARYVDKLTHDYDLLQAYPTALVCIPDPAWDSNNLISRTIEKRILTIDDFNSPFELVFGDIEFAFPQHVLFPCIPVNVNGSLIFPRTSEGLTKCYSSAPEIFLALRLGAEVKARRVYIASKKIMLDGSPSQCFYKVVEQFVHDRQLAKEIWGNKSFEQSLLKIGINSIYGKIAQNIKPKSSWNAASAMMEDIGCSTITSPVHACLITAGVRAVLNATINQLSALGRKCYSVTTDGFISDATLDELRSLDLYGFREIFGEARKRLTGSPEMWEAKHSQTSFLNFSTRGNISLDDNGVCAHNGFHVAYKDANYGEVEIKPNGLIDRYSTTLNVALRHGRICSSEKHFTGFRELSYHGDNSGKKQDLLCEDRERNLRMDFDMKRKPSETSFEQVFFTVKGVTEQVSAKGELKTITLPDVQHCEWMNFDSAPYENVDEYKIYRKVYEGTQCLRTKNDWDKFWLKIHALLSGDTRRRNIRDAKWTILNSVIRGHRHGLWDIPALSDPKMTVKDKVAWINKFNDSDKTFTESSWKNCGRKDRKDQILSKIECEALLELMLAG